MSKYFIKLSYIIIFILGSLLSRIIISNDIPVVQLVDFKDAPKTKEALPSKEKTTEVKKEKTAKKTEAKKSTKEKKSEK